MPTEYGSKLYSGHRPKADASLVALTRRFGGIVLARRSRPNSPTSIQAKPRTAQSRLHPGRLVRRFRSAVAAGFVPLATGSQTGGSVIRAGELLRRRGLKPSYRMLPTIGMKCVSWHLDTAGLFAASVADVGLRRGRHRRARPAGRPARTDVAAHRRAAAAAVALGIGATWRPLLMWRTRRLLGHGAGQGRAAPPVLSAAFRAHATIQGYEAARSLAFEYDRANEVRGSARTPRPDRRGRIRRRATARLVALNVACARNAADSTGGSSTSLTRAMAEEAARAATSRAAAMSPDAEGHGCCRSTPMAATSCALVDPQVALADDGRGEGDVRD